MVTPLKRGKQGDADDAEIEMLVEAFSPFRMAVDPAAGKMYWTLSPRYPVAPGKIQRANLNGSFVEDLAPSEVTDPEGLTLDPTAGKIYWADSGRIRRMDLDGANAEDVITASGIFIPHGVALGPSVPDGIPAVSAWGMFAMTLLLLVVASLVFLRRCPVTVGRSDQIR